MLKEKILKFTDQFIKFPVAGMDISDLTMKYFEFSENRKKIRPEFWGEINIPPGLISNGEIKDEENLVKHFQRWLKTEGRKMRSVFWAVSLPEEKSFLRLIQLPKVKQNEIENAIRWEIEANVPLSLDKIIYGYEIVEPLRDGLDHFDIVVTAFPRAVVDSYVRVLKEAGFRILALELESQAIARALFKDLRSSSARAIADVGRNRTSFIIFAGGAIVFTATIELGGKNFEENIAKVLNVSKEEALSIKIETGLNKKARDGKVFGALVPAVSALADEFKRALEYYQTHGQHGHGASEKVEEIYLAGGDANLLGLDTYLASFLGVPVKRGNPFVLVENKLKEEIIALPRNQALAFTTAIGLALREK